MLLPKTIKTGNAIGIVIKAPRTEPLFKLRALPKTNKCKNIYELIIDKGNIKKLKVIFSLVPNEKTKLNIEIGIPINSQYVNVFATMNKEKEIAQEIKTLKSIMKCKEVASIYDNVFEVYNIEGLIH